MEYSFQTHYSRCHGEQCWYANVAWRARSERKVKAKLFLYHWLIWKSISSIFKCFTFLSSLDRKMQMNCFYVGGQWKLRKTERVHLITTKNYFLIFLEMIQNLIKGFIKNKTKSQIHDSISQWLVIEIGLIVNDYSLLTLIPPNRDAIASCF